jgi:hypothetical protein
MYPIGTDQAVVTADILDRGPTAWELADIASEMPLILADVALLDAEIMTIDRPLSELDVRHLRRTRRRVLDERRKLSNRSATVTVPGGAA